MTKITKLQSDKFVEMSKRVLLKLGAKEVDPYLDKFRSFVLETPVGPLRINVDTDNTYCFTIFSKFDDPAMANNHLSLHRLNPFSGKYNLHIGKNGPLNPTKIRKDVLFHFGIVLNQLEHLNK